MSTIIWRFHPFMCSPHSSLESALQINYFIVSPFCDAFLPICQELYPIMCLFGHKIRNVHSCPIRIIMRKDAPFAVIIFSQLPICVCDVCCLALAENTTLSIPIIYLLNHLDSFCHEFYFFMAFRRFSLFEASITTFYNLNTSSKFKQQINDFANL